METILFDYSCIGWSKNREMNRMFLELQRRYFTDLLLNRGYVYLNEIYERLGAEWDPNKENICWHGRPIWIEFKPFAEYDFIIKIS